MLRNIWQNTFVNTIIEESTEIAHKYVGVHLFYRQWDISAPGSLLFV